LEKQLRRALTELRDLDAGKLTIGANESTALYLLEHLEAFRRRHPRIAVELRRSLSSEIPDGVLEGSIELGAISYDPKDPNLAVFELYNDSLTFVVSPKHSLARRRKVSIRELGEETFIAHNVVSPYRERVIEAFRTYDVPLNMAVEMPTIETIRRLVQRNLGVAFLPKMCVEQEIKNGSLKEVTVKELAMERKIRLVYPMKRKLSQAVGAFLELVGEELRALKVGR
jgi:DNA-binding transcriptional LysR family regulator